MQLPANPTKPSPSPHTRWSSPLRPAPTAPRASINATTLISIIEDIRASLTRSGVTKLVLVNGHGGNYILSNVAQQANAEGRHVVLFPGRDDWNTARNHAGMATTGHDDMHGGEMETSIVLHARPELVRDSYATADHDAPNRPHLLVTGVKAYSAGGIIGRPSAATPAKGKAALEGEKPGRRSL